MAFFLRPVVQTVPAVLVKMEYAPRRFAIVANVALDATLPGILDEKLAKPGSPDQGNDVTNSLF
jgi:hypothetical protein